MFYGRLTNRQRVDNDVSFQVSITGYSRAEWSVVMQALYDWLETNHGPEQRTIKSIYHALECHVVENNDGYQIQAQARELTELESLCLQNARERRAKDLREMEEFAKSIKAARRKATRKNRPSAR